MARFAARAVELARRATQVILTLTPARSARLHCRGER
jgi:hypothetical protein